MLSRLLVVSLPCVALLAGGISSLPVSMQPCTTVVLTDPCRCEASQDLTQTHASPNCGSPGNPCYYKDDLAPEGPTLQNGRCHVGAQCGQSTLQCLFPGFKIRIRHRVCQPAPCCPTQDGQNCAEVSGVVSGQLCPGGSVDALFLPGAKDCGSSHTTLYAQVICNDALVAEWTATFRCLKCANMP